MLIRSIFLVLCSAGLIIAEAKAQLFLENAKVSLAVSGGEHLNGTMIIHNTSSEQGTIKVYWEDFEYKAPYDGTKNFLPAGTAPGSASQWVSFSPQVFTLPAMGQQTVGYTVTVPSSIQGGHYGVLFFERNSDSVKNGKEDIAIVTRVGCLFFIEPKNKNKKAVLQDIALKPDKLTASFVNQGDVVLIPRTTFYMMQAQGMVLRRGEINNLYVPPKAAAPLEIPLKKQLKPGHYTLVVNSDLDEGDVVVKEIGLAVDASGQLTIERSQD
jgi:hypothetical protein